MNEVIGNLNPHLNSAYCSAGNSRIEPVAWLIEVMHADVMEIHYFPGVDKTALL